MKRVITAPRTCCNVLLFLLLALPVTCAPAWAAEYIVVKKDAMANNDEITYTKDGGASVNTTLTALVNNGVESGDTVSVGQGTYTVSETLKLKAGVKLIGAGADRTILTGNNILTIIECTDPAATTDNTLLSGFTVTGSNAEVGGGMYILRGSPTVTDCTFSGNSAGLSGGGMYILRGSPTVTDCTFSGNSAGLSGGGMSITNGSPTVTDCTFSGNSATYGGGGMSITNGSPEVTNCTFSGNQAGYGGGMVIGEGNPTVTDCTFSGNQADGGGGMVIGEGNPKVTNCTFAGNSAGISGGGMRIFGGSPTVTDCTFAGNSAADGSAISINNSTVTLKNCVVDGVEVNKSGSVKSGN